MATTSGVGSTASPESKRPWRVPSLPRKSSVAHLSYNINTCRTSETPEARAWADAEDLSPTGHQATWSHLPRIEPRKQEALLFFPPWLTKQAKTWTKSTVKPLCRTILKGTAEEITVSLPALIRKRHPHDKDRINTLVAQSPPPQRFPTFSCRYWNKFSKFLIFIAKLLVIFLFWLKFPSVPRTSTCGTPRESEYWFTDCTSKARVRASRSFRSFHFQTPKRL